MRTSTIVCSARFSCRSPQRFNRWRTTVPDEASIVATPPSLAKAASERSRPQCDHDAMTWPTTTGPIPTRSSSPGATRRSDLRLPGRLQLASGDLLAPPQASPCQLEVAPAPLPPGVAANRRRGHPVQPDVDRGYPLSLSGRTDPHAVDPSGGNRRIAQRHELAESRMRGNAHVRFGSAGRGNGCFETTTPRPGRSSPHPRRAAAGVRQPMAVTGAFRDLEAVRRSSGGSSRRSQPGQHRLCGGFAPT
jgi:hypothetical protein